MVFIWTVHYAYLTEEGYWQKASNKHFLLSKRRAIRWLEKNGYYLHRVFNDGGPGAQAWNGPRDCDQAILCNYLSTKRQWRPKKRRKK